MKVFKDSGRHRRPKGRLPRTIATALLITLLLGAPTITSIDRPAVCIAAKER